MFRVAEKFVSINGESRRAGELAVFIRFTGCNLNCSYCDTAWAYNNKKGGVYFFWDADQNAYAGTAATAFTPGQLALAGIGGLFLGIIGGALVCRPRRRRDGDPSAV